SHLPRTLAGYVENKIREWQQAHPQLVAVGAGYPPLNTVMEYVTAAVPVCQTQWNVDERRYAVKKESSYRGASSSSIQIEDDTGTSYAVNSMDTRASNGNRVESRSRGPFRSNIPQ